MLKQTLRRVLPSLVAVSIIWPAAGGFQPAAAQDIVQRPPIIHKVKDNDRIEMTVNTSRRLTLDHRIKEVQVNNPDVLEPTALSPNVIQISAKMPGVTQVNLFGEGDKIDTVDVIVYGDARELTMLLRAQFPNAALKVIPVGKSVVISGYVDKPEHVSLIVRVAEEYYPVVHNNMTISGVNQVLLHVKVMEVSRTKLRAVGFDWTQMSGSNVFRSGISGMLLGSEAPKNEIVNGELTVTPAKITTSGSGSTFSFDVMDGTNSFFGLLEALRQDGLLKVHAEPTIVAISGRPSSFHVGGTFFIKPQGLQAADIKEVKYGTTLDFIAIVLGNGRIRLEVRPTISDVDSSVVVDGVPGLRNRTVETGVELQAGHTLAIAGLVQTRTEANNRGLPWISEVPYIGALFRRVEHKKNDVELLITVTPEFIEGMEPHQVPSGGPGMETTDPSDGELFLKGFIEVPAYGMSGGGNRMIPHGSQGMSEGTIIREEDVVMPMAGRSNRANSRNRYARNTRLPVKTNAEPSFIGPVGYDVLK